MKATHHLFDKPANPKVETLVRLKRWPNLLEKWQGRVVRIFCREHGCYWRQGCAGYVQDPKEAGLYPFQTAFEETRHCDPSKGIEFELVLENTDTCEHYRFEAKVEVNRLTATENGPITGYSADVRIKCADCGLPFLFKGLPWGVNHNEATMSTDNREARLPIEPYQQHTPCTEKP